MSFSTPSFKNPVSVPTGADQRGHNHGNSGEIHVIFGPMFAGKTTALLRRVNSEAKLGRNVVMIKSNKDIRYAVDAVVTHDGTKFPCWSLPNLSSFKQRFGPDAYKKVGDPRKLPCAEGLLKQPLYIHFRGKVDVIGIDEAQFFDDLYDFCYKAADIDGKTLVVAGLDGDYLRRKFGSVLDIIPLADSVTKLKARCEICGKRAFFTLRKTEEMQKELIGGAATCMPVCRQHYVNGKSIMESAKKVIESHQVQELIPEKPLVA